MKYRILKSISHNFTHSFVSYSNYVDDGYVIDDLRQLARKANGDRIRIWWIPEAKTQQAFSERILKSIAIYKKWLPEHFNDSGASLDVVQEFWIDIFLKPSKQIACEAHLLDDRGVEHVCNVYF